MIRLLIFMTLMSSTSLFAEMSVENERDRLIHEKSYVLAAEILSKDIRSKAGSDLVKFCAWLNPEHEGIKAIRTKLVFGDPVTAVGKGDSTQLAKLLMFRLKDFDAQSKRILYTVIAASVDPQNVDASAQMKEFKDQGADISLAKALKESEKPKLVDLAEVAKAQKKQDMKVAEENSQLSTESASKMSVSADAIEKMLDLIKFKTFTYSEATFLDAVNRLTHKMYWRGVQFTLTGRRISIIGVQKAHNGALYYSGPLYPQADYFTIKDKSLRDILDHMGKNMDLDYKVRDGEVAFMDAELSEISEIGEEGIDANDLMKTMKDFNLKDIKKYRGKSFRMNGIVSGLGRGMDSRTVFLALDGGFIQLYCQRADLEQDVYKRLDFAVDAWKKDGGLKKYKDAVKKAKETGEEIIRKDVADPKLYITFKATCKGMDKGRLVFDEPEYIYVEGPEEYLLRKK
ncbi:MAG: hypothetical protein NE328_02935 [Lentisphaeraceae bacterium]|nr:hypothetical protein [Lentisphaeraceae bacterium]